MYKIKRNPKVSKCRAYILKDHSQFVLLNKSIEEFWFWFGHRKLQDTIALTLIAKTSHNTYKIKYSEPASDEDEKKKKKKTS